MYGCVVNLPRLEVRVSRLRNQTLAKIKDQSFSQGFFPLPDSDSDSDMDSCTMQDFPIGSDLGSDPLIEMYVIRTDISP